MSERVTLAQLRKLARQVLGRVTELEEWQNTYDGDFYCQVESADTAVTKCGDTQQAARRQLRELLERLVRGEESR